MIVTHLGHACVLVEAHGARVLIDPGTDSTGFDELRGLTAILVTHEHEDHVDYAAIPRLIAANPGAALITDRDTAQKLPGARVAEPGDQIELGGLRIGVVGGAHAPVYLDVPGCTNNGYVLGDGEFYHPGDSFVAPEQAIDILALPIGGPWLRVSDAVEFLAAVHPRVALPIHEAALAEPGQHIGMVTAFAPEGVEVVPLDRGVAREF